MKTTMIQEFYKQIFCCKNTNGWHSPLTGFVATNVTVNITIPTQSDPVLVKSVFGWITIHQRLGSSVNWNRTWAEYKAGFGSIDADFWLGLEKVHLLTSSQPYRLRVEVQDQSTNLWYSAEYWSFKIGDESNDKYRLEVAGYSGDAGDSLHYLGDLNGDGNFGIYNHNGMKFTTNDQDNDPAIGNCCAMYAGGWWYNMCFRACLTCIANKHKWSDSMVLVNSRMMIKPRWRCIHCRRQISDAVSCVDTLFIYRLKTNILHLFAHISVISLFCLYLVVFHCDDRLDVMLSLEVHLVGYSRQQVWSLFSGRQLYSVSKKIPFTVFWNFFPNGWEFLINFYTPVITILPTRAVSYTHLTLPTIYSV